MARRNDGRSAADAHAQAPQIRFGGPAGCCRLLEHGVFIGETHRRPVGGEDVHVTAAAERSGREGRHEIAGVQWLRHASLRAADHHALPPGRSIRPVGSGVFRTQNESHAIVDGTGRHDAAAGAAARLVEDLHATRRHFDPLDSRAVKGRTVRSGPDVVDDPPGVGRPDADVREQVAVGGRRDLSWLHGLCTREARGSSIQPGHEGSRARTALGHHGSTGAQPGRTSGLKDSSNAA